jgi:uncharacterized integral membrane protein
MINIIFLLIAGIVLTYISKYNLELVTVNLGMYTISNIPLFYVIVGSILVGVVLSYLMQLLSNVYTYFEMRTKSKQIKSGQDEILNLTKTVHQLELQNEKLKHTGPEVGDPYAL